MSWPTEAASPSTSGMILQPGGLPTRALRQTGVVPSYIRIKSSCWAAPAADLSPGASANRRTHTFGTQALWRGAGGARSLHLVPPAQAPDPASLAEGWWLYCDRFDRPSNPRSKYLAYDCPWAKEAHLSQDPSRRRSRLLLDCCRARYAMPNPRLGGLRLSIGYHRSLRRPGCHRRRRL
jgi:hypothetical protein